MIHYKRGGIHFFLNVFKCSGSVFPLAIAIATPCACVTFAVKYCMQQGFFEPYLSGQENGILKDSSTWGSFMFLVGFLVVFRTSEAYSRFWDGCSATHQMRAEWFNAYSGLIAFCKGSSASPHITAEFQNTLVRLFSMLHAVALADIEDSNSDCIEEVNAFTFELVDIEGIDEESLQTVRLSSAKVELVFQWIQQLIVENINTGVLRIPPPILSRSFQELADGMCQFNEAIKISTIPFPFPYAQTCDCLLLLHWLVTPFVVAHWVQEPLGGAVFSFMQVFIYWALNLIAVEIENPFGADANDIDVKSMQLDMNHRLLMLLTPETQRTPSLSDITKSTVVEPCDWVARMTTRRASLSAVWGGSSLLGDDDLRITRVFSAGSSSRCSGLPVREQTASNQGTTSMPIMSPTSSYSAISSGGENTYQESAAPEAKPHDQVHPVPYSSTTNITLEDKNRHHRRDNLGPNEMHSRGDTNKKSPDAAKRPSGKSVASAGLVCQDGVAVSSSGSGGCQQPPQVSVAI